MLTTLTNGEIFDSLPLAADDPRVVDKATRDRLVIFDPTCSPLLRPALAVEDVRPWLHVPPTRFLIAMPRGWMLHQGSGVSGQGLGARSQEPEAKSQHNSPALERQETDDAAFAALSARFPLLAKQLLAHRAALQQAPHGHFWWELPPYSVDFFKAQLVIWPSVGPLQAAPALSGAYLLQGITFTTVPTAFMLGALNSNRVRLAAAQLPKLSAVHIGALDMNQLESAVQQGVGELAELLVEQAQARLAIEQQVVTRILRDLAPPGATAGPLLAEWWKLSFAEFLAELARRFKGDVPFRYRDGWRDYLTEQRVARQVCDAAIARLEADLNTQMQ